MENLECVFKLAVALIDDFIAVTWLSSGTTGTVFLGSTNATSVEDLLGDDATGSGRSLTSIKGPFGTSSFGMAGLITLSAANAALLLAVLFDATIPRSTGIIVGVIIGMGWSVFFLAESVGTFNGTTNGSMLSFGELLIDPASGSIRGIVQLDRGVTR